MAIILNEPRSFPAPGEQPAPTTNPVNRIGFWSAILTTVWTVWFMAGFGFWMSGQPKWQGIKAFTASFDPTSWVAWVLPCLLLALTFPVLFSSIHFSTPEARRFWSWLGLLFAVLYGAVLAPVYWLLLTVVRDSLSAGYLGGLDWMVVTSSHSMANSLEGIGYGFMGLATFFAGLAIDGGRLERSIRWLLVTNGSVGAASVALGALGIVGVTMVALVVWAVTLPAAAILLAIRFHRGRQPVARLGVAERREP